MSLFDTLAALAQPSSEEGGSGSSGLMGMALDFINKQPGGLNGLIQRFHDEGAGDIVTSWISTGENLDIDPQTLTKVLGSEQVQGLAEKVGMSSEQLSGLLAMFLPGIVDRATPTGEVPADGQLSQENLQSSLSGLAGLFGK